MVDATALTARDLVAGYGATTVVRGVDLEVRPGEVVALVGPNGAGKTTAMLTLAGALRAFGGVVKIAGQVPSASMHARVREGLGVVTEQRGVITGLTVRQNIRLARCSEADVLALFPELEQHLDRHVRALSGGQQQMLALGRALGRKPSVLLADELSLGLAPAAVDRLLLAVRTAADRGLAALVVEQHLAKILAVADRFVVMRAGSVVMSGAARDYRDHIDDVYAAYLVPESDRHSTSDR